MNALCTAFRRQTVVTLNQDENDQFRKLATRIKLQQGQIMFREDDLASFVCLIESGHIKIFRSSPLGEIVTVGVRGVGELIGVAEVLSETERSCFAESLENCELWKMDGKTFIKMLHSVPTLSVKVATAMGTRLREAEATILNLVTLEVDRRLARLLIGLAEKGLTDGEKGLRIDMRLKQSEIATMVGTCRQTVTTTFQKLKKEGLIFTRKERIEILDMERLKRFADQGI